MAKISINDKLTQKLAPVIRQLSDINVKILGTETQLLRIAVSESDRFGDTTETYQSDVIDNCIVKHPWGNDIQLFSSIDSNEDNVISAVDLWEVLPISIKFPFEGDKDTKPVDIKKGDMLVEILRDEHDSKIPLVMTVTRMFGAFSNKYIVSKHCEATLFRGNIEEGIQEKINEYVASIE